MIKESKIGRIFSSILVFYIFLLASSCATPSVTQVASKEGPVPELANLIYTLVNEERVKFGLRPLEKDSLLEELAMEHSKNMAVTGHFGHERFGWRDFTFSMRPGTVRGENLSLTPTRKYTPGPILSYKEVATWAVEGWMKSPGHKKNILSTFTHTGVGAWIKGDYYYITQIFEGKNPLGVLAFPDRS